VVGSTSASPSCSVISTAVRAASDSREPPADDARSSSDEGCGAGSSCRVAASGARAPVSQSASSMVSLCAQYISVRYLCNPPELQGLPPHWVCVKYICMRHIQAACAVAQLMQYKLTSAG